MTQDSTAQRDNQVVSDRLRTTAVRDVMHPGIVSCSQAATAAEIARIMASCRVHCVAVIGLSPDERHDPHIWGIVSDLDLLEAVTQAGKSATAATLAKQPVISVRATMSVHDAAKAMVEHGATHVVIVDPDRRTPLGILSTLDVAELLAADAA
jgi:CBS domain-containing protein